MTKPIHPKVKAGGLGAALATAIAATLSWLGVDVPAFVATAWGGLLTVLFGYMKGADAGDDTGSGDAVLILLVAIALGVALLLFGVRFD